MLFGKDTKSLTCNVAIHTELTYLYIQAATRSEVVLHDCEYPVGICVLCFQRWDIDVESHASYVKPTTDNAVAPLIMLAEKHQDS
jgi:hypothetical protein